MADHRGGHGRRCGAARGVATRGNLALRAEPPLSRAWWLHSLLLAAFFVLFLFAENIGEQVGLEPLATPLVLATAGAAILLLTAAGASALAGVGPARGALVASLLVVLFFGYGHVWPAVEPVLHLHRYLLAICALLALLGSVLALRASSPSVRAATGLLNVVALVLVAINVVPIGRQQLASFGMTAAADEGPSASLLPSDGGTFARPDIWYLVFDRYAGQDALERFYGFDNREFLAELEQRGFHVVEHATANYLKTTHSLASTLAMEELDADALRAEATAPDDWTPLYRRLQGSHPVQQVLRDRGYSYLHVGAQRGGTYTNATADRVFEYGGQDEFSTILLETTALVALGNVTDGDAPGGTPGTYGRGTRYQLGVLEQLARTTSATPRFVFAHLLLPHPPYLFNADGGWVTPDQAASRTSREAYLEQVQYANAEILDLVDLLLERADDDGPVILLQADEGPFPDRYAADETGFAWLEATDDELLEKFSILAAYRVPGPTPEELGLSPTTTPVNSFRIIFNALFDAGMPLLPDRNWIFTDQRHIYDLVDVTERVTGDRWARTRHTRAHVTTGG